MELPLVMASRSRRKDISCGARPGLVGDVLRILDMCTGRPVRVERVRRLVNDRWPVNRRNSGEFDMMPWLPVLYLCRGYFVVARYPSTLYAWVVYKKINFLPSRLHLVLKRQVVDAIWQIDCPRPRRPMSVLSIVRSFDSRQIVKVSRGDALKRLSGTHTSNPSLGTIRRQHAWQATALRLAEPKWPDMSNVPACHSAKGSAAESCCVQLTSSPKDQGKAAFSKSCFDFKTSHQV